MDFLGSYGSRRPKRDAVAGMNCISPRAFLLLVSQGRNRVSLNAIDQINFGSTPSALDASTMVRSKYAARWIAVRRPNSRRDMTPPNWAELPEANNAISTVDINQSLAFGFSA